MNFENEEVVNNNDNNNEAESEQNTLSPREILFQVFEQGARACDNWESSQKRLDCLISLQNTDDLTAIVNEQKTEILSVLTSLLQSGQLNFGLQQVLYPLVKELE
jgi:hypothetical protein